MLRLRRFAVIGALLASLNSNSVIMSSFNMFASRVLLLSNARVGLLKGLQVEGQGSREIIIADSASVSSLTVLP